jgi:cytochrome c oxidase subunit IV
MRAYPNLTKCDFQNVQTLGGHYEVVGGTLAFVSSSITMVSSGTPDTISEEGYGTLLNNVAPRYSFPISEIIARPDISQPACDACIYTIAKVLLGGHPPNRVLDVWSSIQNEYFQDSYCSVTSDCESEGLVCGRLLNKDVFGRAEQLLADFKIADPQFQGGGICDFGGGSLTVSCHNNKCAYHNPPAPPPPPSDADLTAIAGVDISIFLFAFIAVILVKRILRKDAPQLSRLKRWSIILGRLSMASLLGLFVMLLMPKSDPRLLAFFAFLLPPGLILSLLAFALGLAAFIKTTERDALWGMALGIIVPAALVFCIFCGWKFPVSLVAPPPPPPAMPIF